MARNTTAEDSSAEDVQTATSQTKVNAAPNGDSSAFDPRPVDTVNSGLVYNDGTPVADGALTGTSDASPYRDGRGNLVIPQDGLVTVYHPGGTAVRVSPDRAAEFRSRGYLDSAPSKDDAAAANGIPADQA